jgi:hypothetical protein
MQELPFKHGNEYAGNLDALNEVASIEGVKDNWVWGSIDDYTFEAKIFATGSGFGIDGGRISKLCVKKDGKYVVNYDRGWDVHPVEGHKKAYNKIIKALM